MVRHSKRQPKPTERGSQYAILLAKQRRNNPRLSTSSATESERSAAYSEESDQADAFERVAEGGEGPFLVPSSPLFEPLFEDDKSDPIAPEEDEGDSDAEDSFLASSMPMVKFLARRRCFNGKETLPGMLSVEQTSEDLSNMSCFAWVKEKVTALLPARYGVRSFPATVYFRKEPKGEQWKQTLEENCNKSFQQILALLKLKRKERERMKGVKKDICVDFDLFLSLVTTAFGTAFEGNQFSTGRTPTERQLARLPTTQAELLATEGQVSEVIIHWKCTSLRCSNYPNVCWVSLRDGEQLPSRVESHYPVKHNVLHVWNREIRMGFSSVGDPSETESVVSTELRELKEIMMSLTRTWAAKSQSELIAKASKDSWSPFGSAHPPWRVLQAFF
ncbi:hypothetical protein HBH98_182060 [Parastagonospora nodorum]|nr:hypothetical protein HBH53_231710 [Parastagonospora nodorum]KAH4215667.1 hypothetical protein HBI06_244850 [Parastagonospora nodorum]KAH4224484.1 hypothetical protein HBI05_237120 [Parastagonospora nodorum]KAH4341238.1 hypothetical protein HBH98_182060 [Parastagonospora nodorum]KAH4378234.1 hypothetical protein HBH99_204950 [Parastagonospora nodorum]